MNLLSRYGVALLLGVVVVVLGGRAALAQDDAAEQAPSIAVVIADDTLVRSGASDTYYPFGRLKAGSPLVVVGELDNWARVLTVGPAFRDLYGYVRYLAEDQGRVGLQSGNRGICYGRQDVLAPNLTAGASPGESWKFLVRLEPNDTFQIIETERVGAEIVHKVVLPEHAVGWVNKAALRSATGPEQTRWHDLLTAASRQRPRRAAIDPMPGPRDWPTNYVLAREEPTLPNVPPLLPPLEQPVAMPASDGTEQPAPAALTTADTGPSTPPAPAVVDSGPSGEPTPPPRPELVVALEDLEVAYELLREEPIETAELEPLRALYLDLAERSESNPAVVRYARARAEQLAIWSELQSRRAELGTLRSRLTLASEEADAVRRALQRGSGYVAVGRLIASTIYDGRKLPLLYRLQDPITGRTVGYLRPNDQVDLVILLGQLVGVVGERSYDGSLRLYLVQPDRLDILAPVEGSPQA